MFILIAAFVALVPLAQANPLVCDPNVPFDVMMLSLQWPPGICFANLKEKCVDYDEKFTIHGNWPSYANGSWPEYCCFQRNFDARKVDEVAKPLKDNWGTLFQGKLDNQGFWKHEWQKHGTCAAISPKLKGQTNYFKESLALYKAADIKNRLAKAGITPTATTSFKSYSVASVHKAIESQTGHKIRLECRRLPRRISPEPIISGIYLCYDPKTLNYIDCTQPDDQDCGKNQLYFLAKDGASTSTNGNKYLMIALNFILAFLICSNFF